VVISAFLILILLSLSSSARFARFTGFAAGCLVATYITFESPLSGMSMNPARSFASAAPGMQWQYFWIYVTAPVLGMLIGAQIFLVLTGARRALCARQIPDRRVINLQRHRLDLLCRAPKRHFASMSQQAKSGNVRDRMHRLRRFRLLLKFLQRF